MKAEKKTIIARICSVVINLIFAVAGFFGTLFGLLFMSPYPLFSWGGYDELDIDAADFFTGVALLVGSIVVPVVANLLLHRFWYSKWGLSKKWIYIPIAIITVGLLGFACYFIIVDGYIEGWLEATWHW
ncbi:MAG: hypothetical protein IJ035_01370 [Oscillospiraceae bacterium]|nr:hypothetical protein [Oscillospiraceae bacterium]